MIWQLIQNGAHLYVCGDAKNMARDVHNALCQIVAKFGNMTTAEAEQYLANLEQVARYEKDVWVT